MILIVLLYVSVCLSGASVSVINTKDLPLDIKRTLTDFVEPITANSYSLEQ